MTTIWIGPWTVDADVEVTRGVYAVTKRAGSPRDCSCQGCRNLLALAEHALPAPLKSILYHLGIDPHKAAELYELCPPSRGFLVYRGWFHCSGWVDGPGPWPEQVWHPISKSCEISCLFERDLAFGEFDVHPLVQVEFTLRAPWVLMESLELSEWASG